MNETKRNDIMILMFQTACHKQDLKAIKKMVQYGETKNYESLGIWIACENGLTQLLEFFLKTQCPFFHDSGTVSPLSLAVQNNHLKIVHMLLKDGRADPKYIFHNLVGHLHVQYEMHHLERVFYRFLCDSRVTRELRHYRPSIVFPYALYGESLSYLLLVTNMRTQDCSKDARFRKPARLITKSRFLLLSQDAKSITIGLRQINLPLLLLVELLEIVGQPFANLFNHYHLCLLMQNR